MHSEVDEERGAEGCPADQFSRKSVQSRTRLQPLVSRMSARPLRGPRRCCGLHLGLTRLRAVAPRSPRWSSRGARRFLESTGTNRAAPWAPGTRRLPARGGVSIRTRAAGRGSRTSPAATDFPLARTRRAYVTTTWSPARSRRACRAGRAGPRKGCGERRFGRAPRASEHSV